MPLKCEFSFIHKFHSDVFLHLADKCMLIRIDLFCCAGADPVYAMICFNDFITVIVYYRRDSFHFL